MRDSSRQWWPFCSTPPQCPLPTATVVYPWVEKYCFLCFLPLPWSDDPALNTPECQDDHLISEWELDVIALLAFHVDEAHDGRPSVHAKRVHLGKTSWLHYPRLRLKHHDFPEQVQIHVGCSCHPTRDRLLPMFFMHTACWKQVSQHRARLSHHDLYAMALQNVRTSFQSGLSTMHSAARNASFELLKASPSSQGLLRACANLPPELQLQILGYLLGSGALAPSLLTAGQQHASLASLTNASSLVTACASDRMMRFDPSPETGFIRQQRTRLSFGSGFSSGSSSKSAFAVHGDAQISPGAECPIRHVEYFVGPTGLSALRIVFRDGFKTRWIGEAVFSRWVGIVYGHLLLELRIYPDEFGQTRVVIDVCTRKGMVMGERAALEESVKALWNGLPSLATDEEVQSACEARGSCTSDLVQPEDDARLACGPLPEGSNCWHRMSVPVKLGGLAKDRGLSKSQNTKDEVNIPIG